MMFEMRNHASLVFCEDNVRNEPQSSKLSGNVSDVKLIINLSFPLAIELASVGLLLGKFEAEYFSDANEKAL
jgi:hypothetical protein